MNWKTKTYAFDDFPKKKELVLERTQKIYPNLDQESINKILKSVKITLRDQDEKGASNHKTKRIFIGLNELQKYNITNKDEFMAYMESPKSPLFHEITHIFQNIFDVFPHVQYLENQNGETEINYEKYVADQGEIQARIEHIIELLKWGFTKEEVVSFLYSRKQKDQNLWRKLVDKAQQIMKKDED